MAGHAQLKFVMTECSKTQIRLTGLIYTCTDDDTIKPVAESILLSFYGPASFFKTTRTVERENRQLDQPKQKIRGIHHFNKAMPYYMDRVKRIWYLSPMRAAKVQASLRIRAVSPEPPLLAHTSSESRGTFRQKARSLSPLNDWACAVKICHDGMLEDTNSLDGAHIILM